MQPVRPSLVLAAALAIACVLLISTVPAHAQGPSCQFVLGFKALHDLDPADVGDCLGNQSNASDGDAVQRTTNGMLV